MKILTIGFLILVAMSGQLHADDHLAANNKITLSLDGISEVLSRALLPRLNTHNTTSMWSGMRWQICGLLNQRNSI